jgi:putative transposase
MPASRQRHKNIRLDARNYVGTGWYFLTLCTAGRTSYFRSESLARWVLGALHAEAAREFFRVRAYCVMPDHLHLLLHGASPEANMLYFVKAFKHRTSFRFAGHTGKKLWQTSFYDHILRDYETPADVAWYIWLNPVRAKLAENFAEYPYSGPFPSESLTPPEVAWVPPRR